MAIPTFSDYVYKARASEATEFLGVIRLREEAYRSEFGAYCPTVTTGPTLPATLDIPANLSPDPSTTRNNSTIWVGNPQWQQLGASPSGPVRFGYGVIAGNAGNIPAGFGLDTRPDFWWIARAVGDLDADNTFVMFETYSGSKGVFVGVSPGGAPLAKGWE